MGRVTISILKPGMVLSKPVCNDYQQQLADAGTIVDERVIRLLQTWGVSEVEIQGIAEPSLQEIEAQMSTTLVHQQLSIMIDDRFYGAEPHAFIMELRRLVKQGALADEAS
jgi:hypothetical protein